MPNKVFSRKLKKALWKTRDFLCCFTWQFRNSHFASGKDYLVLYKSNRNIPEVPTFLG